MNYDNKIRLLSYAAIFTAMITVMTAYVGHIPIGANGGYVHFGDSLIYLSAVLLPKPYAIAAAAIGGGLADLLTAPVWTPATIIIKTCVAALFSNKRKKIIDFRSVIAAILVIPLSCAGYFLAELIIFGAKSAETVWVLFGQSVAANALQGVGSIFIFIILGMFLDKVNFKYNFLNLS